MMLYVLITSLLILITARVESSKDTRMEIMMKTGMLAQRETSAVDGRTRTSCTTVGFQCSSDCTQLGYCDGLNWNTILSCSNGELCVNGTCGNFESCPANSIDSNVLCSDPLLKMPDLEDDTCQKYYTCTSTTSSEVGYGKREACPSGQVFERCSGQCTSGVGCNSFYTEEACQVTSTFTTTLNSNRRLSYTCIISASGIKTLWMTCPDGNFIENGGSSVCARGLNYGCTNGNGKEDGDEESCKYFPKQHCNTSTYNLCFPDGSSLQYTCDAGFYFDDTAMECKRIN